MLNDWKQSIEVQWPFVRREWATERECLASAWEDLGTKVRAVEMDPRTTAAKFGAGLARTTFLQRQPAAVGFGKWRGDKGVSWE